MSRDFRFFLNELRELVPLEGFKFRASETELQAILLATGEVETLHTDSPDIIAGLFNCFKEWAAAPVYNIFDPYTYLGVAPKPAAVAPKPAAVAPKPAAVAPKPAAVAPKAEASPAPKPSGQRTRVAPSAIPDESGYSKLDMVNACKAWGADTHEKRLCYYREAVAGDYDFDAAKLVNKYDDVPAPTRAKLIGLLTASNPDAKQYTKKWVTHSVKKWHELILKEKQGGSLLEEEKPAEALAGGL